MVKKNRMAFFDVDALTKLDLWNALKLFTYVDDSKTTRYCNSCLGGKVNASLIHLKYLNYLDLSVNDFIGIQIPEFFGMLENLIYLNLSSASFSGWIPPHLGNLSSLIHLNLKDNGYYLHSNFLDDFSPLSSRNMDWLLLNKYIISNAMCYIMLCMLE